MRKALPILLALAVAGGIAYGFWPRPVLVDFAQVLRGPLEVVVDEEGKTRIKDRYVVSAPLAGRLQRIQLRPGDPVAAGQTLLAVIEPSDPALLDSRARAEAEARVQAQEAAVKQSGTNLERTQAALEFAQAEHRRIRQLIERDSTTQRELENVELLVRTRSEEFKAAQYAEQIARFELELAKAALGRSLPNSGPAADATRIDIHSPIAGRVLHVLQESADIVAPGTELIELGDPQNLEVEVDVLSSDAVAIPPHALARLEHWGGAQPLLGRVRLVEPAAFTKVSALGVEEQRVNVIVDLVDPPEKRTSLGDNYRVEARIVVWRDENVLKVPSSALFRQGDDWAVFRVLHGRVSLTRVKIGHNNSLEAEVLGGLAEQDTVVAHPSDKVVDGVKVVAR